MNCKIAIFDLKGALAPEDQPLMLEPVLFCPVLTWMAQELMCCGVQRYFIVCRENWRTARLETPKNAKYSSSREIRPAGRPSKDAAAPHRPYCRCGVKFSM